MFIGSFLPKKKNKQNQTIKINICIFFSRTFMSAYLLIKENSFPWPNVLLWQKKKNKEKNNKNLLVYFG